MAFGLFILRFVIGALFVGHGTQKLFGWFDGPGPDGTSGMFRSLGYPRPRTMAVLAGTAEAGAGALLLLGWLTPFAAAAIIGVMVNAIAAVHAANGPWASDGGWEYNVVLATAATTFAFAGPGAWSLDAGLGWDLTGTVWGVTAVLLGLVSAGAILAVRQTTPVQEAPAAPAEEERRAA